MYLRTDGVVSTPLVLQTQLILLKMAKYLLSFTTTYVRDSMIFSQYIS
jgi:hypothetical protein